MNSSHTAKAASIVKHLLYAWSVFKCITHINSSKIHKNPRCLTMITLILETPEALRDR